MFGMIATNQKGRPKWRFFWDQRRSRRLRFVAAPRWYSCKECKNTGDVNGVCCGTNNSRACEITSKWMKIHICKLNRIKLRH